MKVWFASYEGEFNVFAVAFERKEDAETAINKITPFLDDVEDASRFNVVEIEAVPALNGRRLTDEDLTRFIREFEDAGVDFYRLPGDPEEVPA